MDREKTLSDKNLKNIYLKMLDYLGRGDMSEERLVKRITRLKLRYPTTLRYEGYTRENCFKVLPLLRDDGYLNEEQYARRVLASLKDRYDGIQLIRRKMIQRDIDHSVIERVLTDFKQEGQDFSAIVKRAREKLEHIKRRERAGPGFSHRIRQKLYAWLGGRGFTGDEIQEIINRAMKD